MSNNPYRGYCLRHCAHTDALLQGLLNGKQAISILAEAMLNGAVFHLYCAYVTHLREISENYCCPDTAAIITANQLSSVLEQQNQSPSEAGEIVMLLDDGDSWLAKVLRAYHEIMAPPSVQPVPVSSTGIELLQDSSTSSEYTGQDVATWLSAMVEMSQRHRDLMQEY